MIKPILFRAVPRPHYHQANSDFYKQIQRFVSKIKCPDPGKLVKLCSYLSSCHFLAVLFTIFTKIWITKNFKFFFWHFFVFICYQKNFCNYIKIFAKSTKLVRKSKNLVLKSVDFNFFWSQFWQVYFFPFWGHFLPKCIKSNQFGQSFR